jgi:hypothetical protein
MHSGAATDSPDAAFLTSQPPASPSSFSQYGTGSVFDVAGFRTPGDSDVGGGGSGSSGAQSPRTSTVGAVSGRPATPGSISPDKANRIARYEAMGSSPFAGVGSDAGFIVTKTNWAGKPLKDSPVARFPNGGTIQRVQCAVLRLTFYRGANTHPIFPGAVGSFGCVYDIETIPRPRQFSACVAFSICSFLSTAAYPTGRARLASCDAG